jgi:hypothetical protein
VSANRGIMLSGDVDAPERYPDKIVVRRRELELRPQVPWAATCGRCCNALDDRFVWRAPSREAALELGRRHAFVHHKVKL